MSLDAINPNFIVQIVQIVIYGLSYNLIIFYYENKNFITHVPFFRHWIDTAIVTKYLIGFPPSVEGTKSVALIWNGIG